MRISRESIVRLDYSIVTVRVLYFLPDYRNLIQEFLWQTLDLHPRYPRIHRFLDHWRRNIDAVIKEITICDAANPPNDGSSGIILPH